MPRAANYFMSYVLVKALTGSASALLQPVTLLAQVIGHFCDVTPRQKWQRQAKLSGIEWARLFPPLTNIAVIGVAFSVIAPLVSVFVSLAFGLYWLTYRYNVLYVYQYDRESGGRFFVAAVDQLFTGVYVMELCLIGHFFLTRGADGGSACVPHGLGMVAILALTGAYQTFMSRTYRPLMTYIPVCGSERSDCAIPSENLGRGPLAGRQVRRTAASSMEMRDGIIGAMHSSACARDPIVWIPRDGMGISADEISSTRGVTGNIGISDDGAWLDDSGNVSLDSCPPDQEESACSRSKSQSQQPRGVNES